MAPRANVIELDMSVDEALKYIISMGVATPSGNVQKSGEAAAVRKAANQ